VILNTIAGAPGVRPEIATPPAFTAIDGTTGTAEAATLQSEAITAMEKPPFMIMFCRPLTALRRAREAAASNTVFINVSSCW
jgi:hypothetical protein